MLDQDLRNHYNEISKECHEKRTPIIITKNGKGDTVVMGLQEYNQMSVGSPGITAYTSRRRR